MTGYDSDSFDGGHSFSNDEPEPHFGADGMIMPDTNTNSLPQARHHIVDTESKTHFVKDHPSIGFQGYIIETKDPFAGFHHICIAYCLMAFLLMYPFVICGRHFRESRKRKQAAAHQQSDKQKEEQLQQQQQQSLSQPQQGSGLPAPPGSDIMQTFTGSPRVGNSETTGSESMDNCNSSNDSRNNQSDGSNSQNNNNGAAIHSSIVLPPQPQGESAGSTCGSIPKGQMEGDSSRPDHDPVAVTPTTTKSTVQDDSDLEEPDNVPVPPAGIAPPGLNHRTRPGVPQQLRHHQQQQQHHQHHQQHSQVASSSGIVSRNAASAATTGQLYGGAAGGSRRASSAAWPRHKHSRRPLGDPSWQWRRAIQTERRYRSRRMEQKMQSSSALQGGGGGSAVGSSNMLFRGLKSGAAGQVMSDLANNVLDAEYNDDKQRVTAANNMRGPRTKSKSLQQQQFNKQMMIHARTNNNNKSTAMRQRQSSKQSQQQQQQHPQGPPPAQGGRMMRRPSHSGSARSGSLSVRSYDSTNRYGYSVYQGSVMSSIVDDISPLDAADADDPGKVRAFPTAVGGAAPLGGIMGTSPCATSCCTALEPWLDVAEPNEEWKRLLGLAIPMTMGAIVEPISRCILVGILSQWVGTHAMVAYLLVNLLYRMSGEILSVAITDAESALVQMSLTSSAAGNNGNQEQEVNGNNNSNTFTKAGYYLAGQYVQLSCLLQLIFVGTILLLWYFWIEDVILWWVDSAEMASLAKSYYEIILILFLAQALYRAIMVPCHMRGAAHTTFETAIDIVVTTATLITTVVVLSQTADIPSEYQGLDKNAYYSYSPEERLADSRTALITVAWIQVIIGLAACVLKMAFCIVKGWLAHFWSGFIRSFAVLVRYY